MSQADKWRAIITAKKSGSEVTYNGDKVYVNGRLVYDPDAIEDQLEYEAEQELRLNVYGSALEELATQHHKYASNFNMWQRWSKAQRLWWIGVAEKQVQAGAQTIATDVVMRAVEIRLTRSFE